MNKKYYEACCYTCQHNGQETCQGCNTFLNGENEPYGNWRLREDLEAKDQRILELETILKEKEKEIEQLKKFDDLNKTFFDLFRSALKEPNNVDDLFNTFKTMQEKQDQDTISFAVEQLEKVKEFCEANCSKSNDIETGAYCGKVIGLDKVLYKGDMSLYDYIDNQIKQLKEEN